MGGKWDEIPILHSPHSPVVREVEDLPPVPFVQIRSPHSPSEQWAYLPLSAPHCHGGGCRCVGRGVSRDRGPFLGRGAARAMAWGRGGGASDGLVPPPKGGPCEVLPAAVRPWP